MKRRLFDIIGEYYRSSSATQKMNLLEVGAEIIEQGGLDPHEEDRIFEALKPRVANRYGT